MEEERMSDLNDLQELCSWMRVNGVRRAKMADVELEFERTPMPAAAPKEIRNKTAQEIAAERHEARRRALALELGVMPSDEMMARLP